MNEKKLLAQLENKIKKELTNFTKYKKEWEEELKHLVICMIHKNTL